MTSKSKILLVDDDRAAIAVIADILEGEGELRFATSGPEALRIAHSWVPDLVLLDIDMPGMDGFDVCRSLKASPALEEAAVLFLTSHKRAELEFVGFEVGGADFIHKPPHAPVVLARVRTHLRLRQLVDDLRREARTDALTGIANRRQFDETLQREWRRMLRSASPIALLMIDVDHFKRYNDFYGHPQGDICLRTVARELEQNAHRPGDLLARYGGEEFAVLLPETDRTSALTVASRLLECIDLANLPNERSAVAPRVTVSIGLSAYDAQCASWTSPSPQAVRGSLSFPLSPKRLVDAADRALYEAKAEGRHRVVARDIDAEDI